ncbi:hypothetical protein AX17_002337 [Amanita inopinata Kibby_2008]|nr:hypothetical protein AX17_002337 [Amanita inopinata Kibby_2008]
MPEWTEPVIPNVLFKTNAYRYRANKKAWKHIHLDKFMDRKCPSHVRILTWNISFDMPGPVERMNTALRHLETDVLNCKKGEAPEPCCILLQEVNVNAFAHLLENAWIRDHFVITPKSQHKWPDKAIYGNVTLVSRSIPLVDCAVLHFKGSAYQRTAVVIDIRLKSPVKDASNHKDSTAIVQIINTHLESLANGLPARHAQLKLLAQLLFTERNERHGGIIAGDMNAIGPNEHSYPAELGLDDAWKKGEDAEGAKTWGYQSADNYPAGRLDKVLYMPLKWYRVDEPKQVGVGVTVKDPLSGEEMPLFASDHYGLDTVLRMTR